ncbi:bifunctional biotin--[acetyl-CoA-carboxylase] ligase/biotin operon repressor BirA [Photobacterium galatheae]|uniref:Bifunctional ligase/repressor BirA n=1 Tax=Photobacterium galatheae TaxID=1654360 RepID=A0A066RPR3_9GAMM|nr:bifunctional biotin--[acetyl-CoA-carboxylase] ligase/biotin operon repressor BirA [Photobacterium galatheae]KDM89652.1 biotin--[acetyl-CoA-carboxylase] synthetase [Photobacterium galatheae]MCM0151730.1 bifunctional biotin--[acetyl-CoA-carboxylase] synthetase/biotin operon repressor [Photobacterium galatheae]
MKEQTTKLALIRTLADGQFHSGEALGEVMGISRAAISKHIKVIQEWGLDVHRVQGKGYRLAAGFELLDETAILSQVDCPSLSLVPVIDSTNQYMLDRIGQLPKGSVCLAEYQQAGRGRRGRQWLSPFGSNLYLSMYWRLDAGVAAAMGLSLVVGLAIAKTLRKLGANDIKVKWPNDLYFQDKKLAGILVEMSGKAGDAAHLVIGMGLNLTMTNTDSETVGQPWANLAEACEMMPDRNQLAAAIIAGMTETLLRYEEVGMAGFVDEWDQYDNFLDRPVKLLMGDKVIRGIARGINPQGALLLETEQGMVPYLGGEISLRQGD